MRHSDPMYLLLNVLPVWATAIVLVGVAVLFALLFSGSIHRRLSPEALRVNNEVAGWIFGVIGSIYGLLLALALVAVWGGYTRARENAADEEACIRSLSRLAKGLDIGNAEMTAAVERYKVAANAEWGKSSADYAAVDAVDDMGNVLANERDAASAPFVSDALTRLDRLADLRAARRANTQSGMPSFLWAIMVLGGMVTVSFSLFLGSPNARAQRAMTAILAATLTLVLFAVLEMDHPYEGEIRVHSPFETSR